MTTNQVSKFTCSDGSYGFRARHNGGIMDLWCCGITPLLTPGIITQSSHTLCCMHRTRDEARRCLGKIVVWGVASQELRKLARK